MRKILLVSMTLFSVTAFASSPKHKSLIDGQEVFCVDNRECPGYIAKVAVVHDETLKFCTGFLTESDTMVTSASCLANINPQNEQDCSNNVFIYFPESEDRPAEKLKCDKIVKVSRLTESDPILWREDVSFLKIEKSILDRDTLKVSRKGLQNNEIFEIWGIEQLDDHIAIIRSQECEAVHSSFINPLSNHESSPNILLAGCKLKNENTGSPIVDLRGNLRGVVSQKVDKNHIRYVEESGLLIEPLKQMFHGSNFACASTLDNSNVLNEQECSKILDFQSLNLLRKNMLSSTEAVKKLKDRLEKQISSKNQFLNLGVNFVSGDNDYKVDYVFPKCFKNVANWISDLSDRNFTVAIQVPLAVIKRTFDSYGKVSFKESSEKDIQFNVQFSPKLLKRTQTTNVYVWSDGSANVYQNRTGTCF